MEQKSEHCYHWYDRRILCSWAEMNGHTLWDAGLPNAKGTFTASVSSSDLHRCNQEPRLGFLLCLTPWQFHWEEK